jgi:hypothetical protein
MRPLLALLVLIAFLGFASAILEQAAATNPIGRRALERAGMKLVNPREQRERAERSGGNNNNLVCEPQGYPIQVLRNYAPARAAAMGYYVGKGAFYGVGDFNGDGNRADFQLLFTIDAVLYNFWNATKSAQITRFFTRNSATGTSPPGPVQAGDYDTYLRPMGVDSNWCILAQQETFGGDLFSLIQFAVPKDGNNDHLGEANNHLNKTTGTPKIHEHFDYALSANDPLSDLRNAGRISTIWVLYAQDEEALPAQITLFNMFDLRKVSDFDPLNDPWPL